MPKINQANFEDARAHFGSPFILDLIAEAGDDLGGELDVVAKLLTGEVAGDATALDVHHLSQIILRLVDGAGSAVGALPSAEYCVIWQACWTIRWSGRAHWQRPMNCH